MTRNASNAEKTPFTNYKLYQHSKYRKAAVSRGCGEEFNSRVNAGEGIAGVLKELLPEEYETYKAAVATHNFRASVRTLLKLGYEPEDLITFIQEQK